MIEKRREFLIGSAGVILSILLALGIGAIIFVIAGLNPLEAYGTVFGGALGGKRNITETLVAATPLLIAGIGVAFTFKCGVWNIGGEGQIAMGTLGASLAAIFISLPAPLHLFVIFVSALVFGGGWAAIAGVFKAKLGINEILTTLMMNYIAIWIVHYFVYGPIRDLTKVIAKSTDFPPSAWLPILLPGTRLHAGLILALVSVVFMYVVFKYTRLGYDIKVIGANPKAAQFSGINVSRTIIITMFIGGALAGIAGMGEVCGIHHFLEDGISRIAPNYGYVAIGVALLGGLSAWGVLLSSLLFGVFLNGTSFLRSAYGLHGHFVLFLVGLIVMATLIRDRLSGRLKTLGILRGKD
jgi:ABC-type uncharacterized transport system permease subunit